VATNGKFHCVTATGASSVVVAVVVAVVVDVAVDVVVDVDVDTCVVVAVVVDVDTAVDVAVVVAVVVAVIVLLAEQEVTMGSTANTNIKQILHSSCVSLMFFLCIFLLLLEFFKKHLLGTLITYIIGAPPSFSSCLILVLTHY
jgi:hypothetical protein